MVLEWEEGIAPTWSGCDLPALVTSAGAPPRVPFALDGSAAFGDVSAAEGSGRVAPDPAAGADAAQAVTCRIKVQLFGVQLRDDSQMEACNSGGGDEWLTVWEKEVVFSDDSAHVARVAQMSQAQRQHAQQAKVRVSQQPCLIHRVLPLRPRVRQSADQFMPTVNGPSSARLTAATA